MADIDDRMTEAAQAEADGRLRAAAHLYRQLGTDIQAQYGQFDPRALDAFGGGCPRDRQGERLRLAPRCHTPAVA
ncbi:hypothetical protein ACIPRU_15540 [Streptomyces sp. NPDC090126]|uniref:hypothetical protein n=1 Tax=Streptomyces sp. NPDC090126 TaxID=3365952 RepID=UPI00380B6ABA